MKPAFPAEILPQHVAVLGKTGSGKTSTEKLLIEQVVADGFRVCVLDTVKSDWWGITSSASGKQAGLDFKILGGPHGHVPLHSSAGKVVGQLVGSGKLPLSIIDMADFEAGGIQKFFTEFAPSLMRNAKGVIYLVIEEAHELAPKERANIGLETLAIYWAKKLATAGRSKGIRLIVATQRVQALHNAVLGSCETLIAHRITTPADQEPVIKWLRTNTTKEVATLVSESLSSLPTGTGWLCSGEAKVFEKIPFPKFRTYDNTATPTGDEAEVSIKTAPVDQAELGKLIGFAIEEAKANDPVELKRKVAELERKLKAAEQKPAEVKHSKPIETLVFDDDSKLKLEKVTGICNEVLGRCDERRRDLQQIYNTLIAMRTDIDTRMVQAAQVEGIRATNLQLAKERAAWPRHPRDVAAPSKPPVAQDNGELAQGEKAILIALAQHPEGCERGQLTILTGYKRSTRDKYIQRLCSAGRAQVNGELILATEAGISELGSDFDPLPTGRALREHYLKSLPEGEKAIFSILSEQYPGNVDRDFIGEQTGYSRSTRDKYIQKLQSRKLADAVGQGLVKASDHLFA